MNDRAKKSLEDILIAIEEIDIPVNHLPLLKNEVEELLKKNM